MMDRATIRDLDVAGKRVLLRTDYNVDVHDGQVMDDLRIEASLPTIRLLLDAGARVVICSHRGRPKGNIVPERSNEPLARHLSELLGSDVRFIPDCIGPEVEQAVAALASGDVALLENLRFQPGEEANDDDFARQLARLADVYVNDAFGTIHRAHASIVGVPRYLPSAAGLLVEREVDRLQQVVREPEHPFALVLGGAKVADKLPMLEQLLPVADVVCLGGAMANAVLRAQGVDIGTSRWNGEGSAAAAARLLSEFERRNDFDLVLPVDVTVTPSSEPGAPSRIVNVHDVPDRWAIADIGPRTVEAYRRAVHGAQTVIWNGPLGIFERPPFDTGTREVALMLAALGTHTVVGGGETITAVRNFGLAEQFWHVSTGGGAALQLLSKRPLPGLEALPDRTALRPSHPAS